MTRVPDLRDSVFVWSGLWCRGALVCFSLLAGCGESLPKIVPVEGVVRVNGEPQAGLVVRFMPDPEKGNDHPINARATTDAQGTYRLKYFFNGREGEGAPVGWHRVLIEDPAFSQVPQGTPLPPVLVPSVYNSPNSTPLRFEVREGLQAIDLDVISS